MKSDKELLVDILKHCDELDNPEGLPCEISCAVCAAGNIIRAGFHRDELDKIKPFIRCGDCEFFRNGICDNRDGLNRNTHLGVYDGCTQGSITGQAKRFI